MHITTLFLWFILYSILGWIYETAYCSLVSLKWDNRGMLNGPYCPIYGIGAVLDVLLCSGIESRFGVFLACMIGSAILEYTTSFATERLFHAVWWDYSRLPLNIKGRVCLFCSVGFGAAGLLILYDIHPFVRHITDPIPLLGQEFAALFLMAVFAADCAWTADSLAAVNARLDAAKQAIDFRIAERYHALIVHMSIEEFREHRMREELKKVRDSLSWAQKRVLRSAVAFRQAAYSDLGNKMRHALFHRQDVDKEAEEKEK